MPTTHTVRRRIEGCQERHTRAPLAAPGNFHWFIRGSAHSGRLYPFCFLFENRSVRLARAFSFLLARYSKQVSVSQKDRRMMGNFGNWRTGWGEVLVRLSSMSVTKLNINVYGVHKESDAMVGTPTTTYKARRVCVSHYCQTQDVHSKW